MLVHAHEATELRVFICVAGILRLLQMAVGCCELRLRSTPGFRLVCSWFPASGRGLPVRTWPAGWGYPGVAVKGACNKYMMILHIIMIL